MFDMSEKMINICGENETNYSSYIVTNGYLINDDIVNKFREIKISGAQITIDGPPYIHNKRRKLKGSDKGTFDVILSNVKKILKAGIDVTIRVNIDKTNIDKLEELLDILEINGLKNIQLTLGQITAYTEACISVAETCLNTEEYAKVNIIFQDILYKRGFISQGYPYYPGTKANYCTADTISSFVVDPDGYMYK
ncbi:MAG: radical SAM protein [Thermoanaerobacteraceae bacterium]